MHSDLIRIYDWFDSYSIWFYIWFDYDANGDPKRDLIWFTRDLVSMSYDFIWTFEKNTIKKGSKWQSC